MLVDKETGPRRKMVLQVVLHNTYSDGSVGPGSLTFTADYVKGAGTFSAYFSVTPSKDSTLWIKADGTAKPEGATTVFPEAPATVLGGFGKV